MQPLSVIEPESRILPSSGTVDIDSLRAHFEKNYSLPKDKVDHLITSFVESVNSYLIKLKQTDSVDNIEEYTRSLHSLKGVLLTMGLDELADAVKKTEDAVKDNGHAVVAKPLVAELQNSLSALL